MKTRPDPEPEKGESLYDRIYREIAAIPKGNVASYGQIAKRVGRCGARQVGYALSSTPDDRDIPWHRVVNSQGRISARKEGAPDPEQRRLLEMEGVLFDARGRIDLDRFGWFPEPPPGDWFFPGDEYEGNYDEEDSA